MKELESYRTAVLAEIDERCKANAGKPRIRHELENVFAIVAKIPLPEPPKPMPEPPAPVVRRRVVRNSDTPTGE